MNSFFLKFFLKFFLSFFLSFFLLFLNSFFNNFEFFVVDRYFSRSVSLLNRLLHENIIVYVNCIYISINIIHLNREDL
jgi:hypothetical protein